jgi:hypothetical protein
MPHFKNLADAADYLAAKPQLMQSYEDFGTGATTWFYSLNGDLAGANPKPQKFDSWNDWHSFRNGQRFYLDTQARFAGHRVAETPANLAKLQNVWRNWHAPYFVVQQGGGTDHHSSCNVFLGECLSLCGYARVAAPGGKYLSAKSFWMNHNHFMQQVSRDKATVKRGMVMSYFFASSGYYHLEVITSGSTRSTRPMTVLGYSTGFDKDIDSFKSRGGGRGGHGENGLEKLGGSEARDLGDENLKILRLKH